MNKQNLKQISEEKWPSVKLGDLVTTVNVNNYDPIKDGFVKYVAGMHIESNKIYVEKYGDIKKNKEILGSAFHKVFQKGQILFGTRRTYLRKAGIATFDGICANTTLVLESKNNSINDLLPFIFHWEKFQKYAIENSVGSTNPYVRWRDLANFEFALPSKDEIKHISELLWKIQSSIEYTQLLLTQYTVYKNSLIKEILTKGIGHKKFKKIKWIFGKEIKIPYDWSFCEVQKVCKKLAVGFVGTCEPFYTDDTGIPMIRTSNVSEGKLDLSNLKYVTREFHNKNKKSQVKKNDLLISRHGTNGEASLMRTISDSNCLNIVIIRPNENLFISDFFEVIFNSPLIREQIQRTSAGGVQDVINTSEIGKLIIFLPSLIEQQKIVSIYNESKNTMEEIEKNLKYLYQLRKNLTNSLLSQKTTLKENTLEN